jgi:hypothetical protein
VVSFVDQDVRRLHVAVHEPVCVGDVQRACDLPADADAALRFQRAVPKQRLQVGAADQPHGDVELATDLPRVVDRDDVRMLERGGEARLAQEPLAERYVLRQLRREQLQRDVAIEGEVARAVDDAHSAAAKNFVEPVASELGADPWIECG